MALLKMTILSFKSFDNPMDLLKPSLFLAMFNPASYKIDYNFTKDKKIAPGSSQSEPISAVNVKKMTFDFLIDGTGANGDNRVVLLEIKKFEKLVMPDKKGVSNFDLTTVNPDLENEKIVKLDLPKLLLVWGTFMFSCEIESFSVNYTLFNQLGIPLRATISATFSEKEMPGALDAFNNSTELEAVTNVASFLSTAYTITNNVAQSVELARSENLNSLRQNVDIKK
jgi:hypothetical protein